MPNKLKTIREATQIETQARLVLAEVFTRDQTVAVQQLLHDLCAGSDDACANVLTVAMLEDLLAPGGAEIDTEIADRLSQLLFHCRQNHVNTIALL